MDTNMGNARPATVLLISLGLALGAQAPGLVSADDRTENGTLNLARAVVVSPEHASQPISSAVALFTAAIRERTRLRLPVQPSWPPDDTPVIAIGPAEWVSELAHRSARGASPSRAV